MGRACDCDEIAPGAGLAAGKMHLEHAERRGLGKNPRPGLSVELALARIKRDRIGTIRAAQRTAVRQLGQEAERAVQCRAILRHDRVSFFVTAGLVPAIHAFTT